LDLQRTSLLIHPLAEHGSVMVPMSGSCLFAAVLHKHGHPLLAVEFLDVAAAQMRERLCVPFGAPVTLPALVPDGPQPLVFVRLCIHVCVLLTYVSG
jgi:hypothetical protein